MLLKKIYLKNIRSYKEQEIFLTSGSTLLSGDIGSGKTSVLLAVEFALFGLQPGQKGASLLRNGATEGCVKIELEVSGHEVIIERTLKKGKTINQDYSAIIINGTKREISVTKLKSIVLGLLNYPKEFSKKQNLLYKFTVYTPQEEMKQIVLQDPETRINTLRHIFGIDKYKRIIENVTIVASKIREEQRRNEGLVANLEQDKSNLITKEEELETKFFNLASIEKELFLKIEHREKMQEDAELIEEKLQEKRKLEGEVEKTKIMISNKKETLSSNKKTIETLRKQIEELTKLRFDESKLAQIKQDMDSKKELKKSLNDENLKISSQISSLNLKNDENKNIKSQIMHLEICPTCLQDVDPNYKANVVNQLDSAIVQNIKQIKDLELEKKEVIEKLLRLDYELSLNEKELRDLEISKIKLQQVDEKQKDLSEIEKTVSFLEKDIVLLEKHINMLKESVLNLSKFSNLYEEKKKELELALHEEKMAEIKVAELKREIEFFSRQIDELKIKIEKTESIKVHLAYLVELENWLSKNFVSLISFIEKNVMTRLKVDFSQLFAKWFLMLVSDSLNVELDNDFTPIIMQQDYELDYAYLSGGERTAVALAYRLALNQVINSFLSKINTKDLVILDEPTDGFSEQQLDKMREVLEQLNVSQLVLVSHEQKIEGFVEHIIRFKKEQGETKVLVVG